jgi:hypothetical protein
VWQPVDAIWVRQDNRWTPIDGSFVPVFSNVSGNFGGAGS